MMPCRRCKGSATSFYSCLACGDKGVEPLTEMIGDRQSGKRVELVIADTREDSWDCVQGTMSSNPYWHARKSSSYPKPKEILGLVKIGWQVVDCENGEHFFDMQHVVHFYAFNMRDPIVQLMQSDGTVLDRVAIERLYPPLGLETRVKEAYGGYQATGVAAEAE